MLNTCVSVLTNMNPLYPSYTCTYVHIHMYSLQTYRNMPKCMQTHTQEFNIYQCTKTKSYKYICRLFFTWLLYYRTLLQRLNIPNLRLPSLCSWWQVSGWPCRLQPCLHSSCPTAHCLHTAFQSAPCQHPKAVIGVI